MRGPDYILHTVQPKPETKPLFIPRLEPADLLPRQVTYLDVFHDKAWGPISSRFGTEQVAKKEGISGYLGREEVGLSQGWNE